MPILINTRILHMPITGVQRYTLELLKRLKGNLTEVNPGQRLEGLRGHLWEQAVLPFEVGRNLLWSPGNTGPLAVRNQVVTIHDVVTIDRPEWLNPTFARWYQWLLPKLMRRVKFVITISEFTKERILETAKIPDEKVFVIHNGVDARFSPQSDEAVDLAIERVRLPSRNYILCLGSLEPRKNLNRLLSAWAQVEREIDSDIWLVVAGAKGKSSIFKDANLTSQLIPQRVHFTGFVEDMYIPALYSGALAFVYPSVYEGFGLPPLEAMACGTPVITGNLTALPEVVGDAAVLVNPYDTDEMACQIKRVIEDSSFREDLRLKGLGRASQFSWDITAKQTWEVLEIAGRND